MAGTVNAWSNQVNGSYNQIVLNAGTNGVAISTDASAATISIATGAAAKLVTLGSTSGASSLALQTGTADFTLASATGTIMSALDTGEITYPLQTAFLAYLASSDLNKTGTGTTFTVGSVTALTVVFDQNSDFNTNGTLTAPVTGKYMLAAGCNINGCTIATGGTLTITTSNRSYQTSVSRPAGSSAIPMSLCSEADMDSADTATIVLASSGEAGDTDDIQGSGLVTTFFSGYLSC